MEEYTGQFHLAVRPFSKVKDLAVSVGFKIKHADWIVLRELKKESQSCLSITDGYCTAICYALFKLIQNKMTGTPRDAMRSQATNLNCNINDDDFIITYNVKGNKSNLRRSLYMLFSCFGLSGISRELKNILDNLQLKADKDKIAQVRAELSRALLDVHVCAVGKISISPPKGSSGTSTDILKEIVEKAAASLPDSKSADHKESGRHTCALMELPAYEFGIPSKSPIISFITNDYIDVKTAYNSSVANKEIVVSAHLASKLASINKSTLIEPWFASKYAKLKQDMAPFFCHYLISTCSSKHSPSTRALIAFLKATPSDSKITGEIHNIIK